jgi:hypothetical protein
MSSIVYQMKLEVHMSWFMSWFSKTDEEKDSIKYMLNNVTINKDGIVKLNLSKKSVRKQIADEALKFQDIESKQASH